MTTASLQPSVRFHTYCSTTAERVLYCFTHAGGTAPFYRTWPLLLPAGVELRALQLPGRLDLANVPAFTDMDTLASAAADAVAEDGDGLPFAFFGHSMGALTAFETARELRRRGVPTPSLLGLSGYRAPQLERALPALHTLPDDELLARVKDLGGIPAEVQRSPELLKLSLPAIRADFTILAGYEYREEPPLDCPFLIFGGESDGLVPEESLWAWRLHSTLGVTVERYPGGHFYLTRWSSRILAAICNQLGR